MFIVFFTTNKNETHRHWQREIFLRCCAILGHLCDANFFFFWISIFLVTMIQETACGPRKCLLFPTFSNLNTYHLYTVDVFQDRWITLEYVILGEIVPPRRVIFLVSSKPYIHVLMTQFLNRRKQWHLKKRNIYQTSYHFLKLWKTYDVRNILIKQIFMVIFKYCRVEPELSEIYTYMYAKLTKLL